MSPADIEKHTADVRLLLKDASYRRVDIKDGGFNPYVADASHGPPIGPMTFAWAFGWTPEAEKQRPAWESMMCGFKACLGTIYPDCGVAFTEVQIPAARLVPLAFSQIYAKLRRTIRGPMVILEADVVCNKRCDPFEAEFDIGLTDGDSRWPMMPFNAGVIFARDTPAAQRFLDTAMEYACGVPENFDQWYMFQLGLSHAYLALKDEMNIKIFPHEEYNYAPSVYAPTDAYFIHLKGNRKVLHRDFVMPVLDGQRGRLVVVK